MTKSELAVNKHRQGYNCAQAVACAFAEELGVDEAVLYKLCEGFGAGMGTGKGVCGALSGAAVVAGFMNSNGDIENAGLTKSSTYKLVAGIQHKFLEQAGSIICHDIQAGASGRVTSCPDCIAIAADIVETSILSRA